MDVSVLNAAVEKEAQAFRGVQEEFQKVIVGQTNMIEAVMIGLLTGGHILIEGLPGLAKSLTISTLARIVDLSFNRIQFTPDLLPSDLIGTMIFNPKTGEFSPKKGPVFCHIVLADEINRAPAKVQSALLECMAEKQVSIGDTTYRLEEPFLVMATQNPIEQEGTYPLPEAQMDRFLFKIIVGYPTKDEELGILQRMSSGHSIEVQKVLDREQLLRSKEYVNQIYIDDKLTKYIVEVVLATRDPKSYGLGSLSNLIQVGSSPRATIGMARAAKAKAFLSGRGYVTAEDVKSVATSVLRHRLILSFEAEAEGIVSDEVIATLLSKVEVS
ncbi:MAG: MoxR family ATPase [Bdellovibrionaceae bacterium]|nr:MoxR family ATPase [Pseudobdellovibrionaceae bacterium]